MAWPGMSLLVAATFGAIQFTPPHPTPCDVVTLLVTRTFMEDCLWQVQPSVRRKGTTIEVTLELKGQPGCDQAVTQKKVEVELGKLPEGIYEVILRWSDSEMVERALLQVPHASRGRARSEEGK
jgi:hypothetical protein